MHDAALNDPIANGLPDDVLSVLFRVQMELDADISQGDARVREGEAADTGLDDVLAQTHNQCVRFVCFKLCGVLGEGCLELRERASADRYNTREQLSIQHSWNFSESEELAFDDVKVGGQSFFQHRVSEQTAVGYVSH